MTRSQSTVNRRAKKTAGSFGSNSNSVEKLSQMLAHVPASVQDRVVGPSPAEMVRAVNNGECPFCGRKFKNIAAHTNRTHGIDRFQLKDMLGIPKSRAACSPEYQETCRERSKRVYAETGWAPTPNQRGKRSYSEGGLAVQRRKIEKAREVQRTKIAAGERVHGDANRAVIDWLAKHNSELRRNATADRDQKILAMVQAGASAADIRQRLDITNAVIKGALDYYGIHIDMRRRRPPPPREQIDAAKAARDANLKQQADQRLARWNELGKNWDAVHQCAREWETDAKNAAAWLRHHGEAVPDGRQTSKRVAREAQPRIQRWRELGGDWRAIQIMADELGLRTAGLAQYLRNLGQTVPDGRRSK